MARLMHSVHFRCDSRLLFGTRTSSANIYFRQNCVYRGWACYELSPAWSFAVTQLIERERESVELSATKSCSPAVKYERQTCVWRLDRILSEIHQRIQWRGHTGWKWQRFRTVSMLSARGPRELVRTPSFMLFNIDACYSGSDGPIMISRGGGRSTPWPLGGQRWKKEWGSVTCARSWSCRQCVDGVGTLGHALFVLTVAQRRWPRDYRAPWG